MGTLVRSAVLGLAVGGRTSTAFAVPVMVGTRGRTGMGAALLRLLARAAVVGELVGDKLPSTPSRTDGPVLYGRTAAGALGALALSVLERRRVGSHLVAVVAGGAGAFVGSIAGREWRRWADEDGPDGLRPDWKAAVMEDALVLGSAACLVGTSRDPRF